MEYRIIGDDGLEYGPVNLDRLREWARNGRVSAFTMVQRSDTGRWALAGNYEELEGYVKDMPPPPSPESPPQAGIESGQNVGGPQGIQQPQRAESTTTAPSVRAYPMPGRGSTVLTLGLISILSATIFSCVCLGIFVAPLTGIAAWIMGAADLRKIDGGLIPPYERSFTKAGMVCGIIGTFLGPILGVAVAAISAFSILADLIHNVMEGW